MNDRVKIKLYQGHFAYISRNLMIEFNKRARVVNFTSFIIKSFYDQFGFKIRNQGDLQKVDEIVLEYFYQDKSEWLRELMRNEINKKEGN